MVVSGLLGKAAGTVVTGVVGVSAYELLRKALAKAPLHDAAVSATEWSLRGTRRAEEAAGDGHRRGEVAEVPDKQGALVELADAGCPGPPLPDGSSASRPRSWPTPQPRTARSPSTSPKGAEDDRQDAQPHQRHDGDDHDQGGK